MGTASHADSRCAITPLAASPASFHPSKAATSTGSTSSGTSSSSTTRCLLPTPRHGTTGGGRRSRGGGPAHDRWLASLRPAVDVPHPPGGRPSGPYAGSGTCSGAAGALRRAERPGRAAAPHLPSVVWTISTSQGERRSEERRVGAERGRRHGPVHDTHDQG